ncbi:hypothetical protein PAXRUDRAFT_689784 [Paxillus rubicundulus Ve08.2h10]|uniref:Uncharacterized protein n=1 Tax=Paxillus rubicundulus Ve08.2h10 TaxID=930991 RepID=A0A0D0DV15_9AGAM|nr:hypothetical protein PAXRUDRAFT_689784 [Paxillus rubicundulus Ve08.2h10]
MESSKCKPFSCTSPIALNSVCETTNLCPISMRSLSGRFFQSAWASAAFWIFTPSSGSSGLLLCEFSCRWIGPDD